MNSSDKWALLLFTEQNLLSDEKPRPALIKTFETIAWRRFFDQNLADAAMNFALDAMSADGWAKLGLFDQYDEPRAFAITVFKNLLGDYANKPSVFGRCRPPQWCQKLGGLWPRVYTLLCCQKKAVQQIHLALRNEVPVENPSLELEEIARRIKARDPSCGHERVSVSDEVLEWEGPAGDDHHGLEMLSLRSLVAAYFGLEPESEAPTNLSETTVQRLKQGLQDLKVAPETITFTKLVHQSGFTMTAAASAVGLKYGKAVRDYHTLNARVAKLLTDLGLNDEH